jgi:hypothetical protein
MALFCFTSLLILCIWLIINLLLLPIQTIAAFHLPNWLGLAAVFLGFAWLAAE